ncbi:MAG: glycogen debranching N-terminal domain-containing protein [Aliidongia sp.]
MPSRSRPPRRPACISRIHAIWRSLLLTVNGIRPLLLSSFVTEDNGALIADLTNPDLVTRDGLFLNKDSIHILATTVLGDGALFQTLVLRNFSHWKASIRLELSFGADFADIFEVRGTPRSRHGEMLADERTVDGAALSYRGLDGITRRTALAFDPVPEMEAERRAAWPIVLEPSETRTIEIAIRCSRDGRPALAKNRAGSVAAAAKRRATRRTQVAQIFSSNESFNDWVSRSRADLEMLITETPQGPYAYAGIPWFSTAFGRGRHHHGAAMPVARSRPGRRNAALSRGAPGDRSQSAGRCRARQDPARNPAGRDGDPRRSAPKCPLRAITAGSIPRRSSSCWPPPIGAAPATSP